MGNMQDEMARKKLGERLKKARGRVNLTQDEVVKKAGISANYFAKIERGEVNTTFEKLYKIIKALKIEASDIFPN
jgi:transcriptional regulator with XRE-family HTH domain